ncbi:YncE family protein [Nocardia sp. NPDC056000]|uniref:YncE family protein n=1 Tax=Nocardia sp. NPDC056000 TaxID=3345674 RepID=UPI0035E107B0
MRRRGWIESALAGAAVLTLLAGCSSSDDGGDKPTIEPATPAAAPVAAAAPTGEVTPFAAVGALLAEPSTGILAVLSDAGKTLSLIDKSGTRAVPLPGPAAALAAGKPGEILIAVPGKVLRLDAATAKVTEIAVDGDVRSVALRADGDLVAGLAKGKVLILAPDGAVRESISGLASADAIDTSTDTIVVLDRRQSALTELNLPDKRLGLTLRSGDGATNLIGDHFGRRIVTDTAGAELLVYTADPLVLRQRFPVGSSPYALAYDQRSETVWVTLTGSNQVVGYDLSTGIPVEVGRYPTVRQPNTVTVDARTGDLFVGSATGDGLQRISADQRKRGQ